MYIAEGMLGDGFPEVLVLAPMGVHTGGVGDDAEGKEGDAVEMAGLGYGATLHIYGEALGEGSLYGREFGTVGDELVAGTDEAEMEGGGAVRHRAGHGEEMLIAGEAGGHTLHLAVVAFAAPHIVIDDVAADDDIHNMEGGVDAAGYTGADNGGGGIGADEFGGTTGRVDFAYAAAGKNYLGVAYVAEKESEGAVALLACVSENLVELVVLGVECYDYSDHRRIKPHQRPPPAPPRGEGK